MDKRRWKSYLWGLFLLFGSALISLSQPNLALKEILDKNIQAAGGREKLSQVENYSFSYGTSTCYMSADGFMKIIEGKKPVMTEIIAVDQKQVRRNCFNRITEIKGLQKSTYQSLALLRCGLFTLIKFKDQLDLEGIKSFGPEKYYLLTTSIGDLKVKFYLHEKEFTLKRIVFQGFNQEAGKYEINHDLGPYQEINGIKIPSSWFSSRVGARGRTYEIAEVKMNLELEKNFYSNLELNVGEVEIAEEILKGNIIEFMFRQGILMIATNWTKDCLQRAGFKTEDKLILQVGDKDVEIDFYESNPPRGAIAPGKKFMMPNPRSENFLIYLWSSEYKELEEKLEPLLPIRVKRK